MKIMHLSDLHIGKSLNGFSLIEDQKFILDQIQGIADEVSPKCIIIAGDIYDRSSPAEEAIRLFDDFLCRISCTGRKIFIVSGNHDSAERLSFGGKLMEPSGVYISKAYNGTVSPISVSDGANIIDFYLLPFVKPAHVRHFFPDEEINTYTDALKTVIEGMNVDSSHINILVSHQNVTDAEKTESEETVIGGLDNVDAYVFEPFNYVALGHLHRPQYCGRETIRYCGTPLKYSFSEEKDVKSVTVIDVNRKDDIDVETIPLNPLRDLHTLKGLFDEITNPAFYGKYNLDDYFRAVIKDEDDVPNVMARLREIYPNMMEVSYDNGRTKNETHASGASDTSKNPLEHFEDFYKLQNGKEMSDEQRAFVTALISEIWEG